LIAALNVLMLSLYDEIFISAFEYQLIFENSLFTDSTDLNPGLLNPYISCAVQLLCFDDEHHYPGRP